MAKNDLAYATADIYRRILNGLWRSTPVTTRFPVNFCFTPFSFYIAIALFNLIFFFFGAPMFSRQHSMSRRELCHVVAYRSISQTIKYRCTTCVTRLRHGRHEAEERHAPAFTTRLDRSPDDTRMACRARLILVAVF
jgi:hypothetical protein